MTYQAIDTAIKYNKIFDFSQYDYIVCDEAHYFIADANFNNTTYHSLEAILEQVHAKRIFMSATGTMVFNYIEHNRKLSVKRYDEFDINFDFVSELKFFKTWGAINTIMEDIPTGEKVICFVNNVGKALELQEEYPDSLFNCSKSRKEYRHVDKVKINDMLANERFDEQMLITTTAMDTGCNIVDKDVKHIILYNIFDTDIIKQCIGRKRQTNLEDKIKVYVFNMNNNILGGMVTKGNKLLKMAKYLMDNGRNAYVKKFGADGNIDMVFNTTCEELMKVNMLTFFRELQLTAFMETVIKNFKYGHAQFVAQSLNKKFSFIENDLKNDNISCQLEYIVEKQLDRVAQLKLIETIDYRIDGRQKKGVKSLNNAINEEGLPYVITTKKVRVDGIRVTVWVVCRVA